MSLFMELLTYRINQLLTSIHLVSFLELNENYCEFRNRKVQFYIIRLLI